MYVNIYPMLLFVYLTNIIIMAPRGKKGPDQVMMIVRYLHWYEEKICSKKTKYFFLRASGNWQQLSQCYKNIGKINIDNNRNWNWSSRVPQKSLPQPPKKWVAKMARFSCSAQEAYFNYAKKWANLWWKYFAFCHFPHLKGRLWGGNII